jgi:hypothetical protein
MSKGNIKGAEAPSMPLQCKVPKENMKSLRLIYIITAAYLVYLAWFLLYIPPTPGLIIVHEPYPFPCGKVMAMGCYFSDTQTIVIVDNIWQNPLYAFTLKHELQHSYGVKDEKLASLYAFIPSI